MTFDSSVPNSCEEDWTVDTDSVHWSIYCQKFPLLVLLLFLLNYRRESPCPFNCQVPVIIHSGPMYVRELNFHYFLLFLSTLCPSNHNRAGDFLYFRLRRRSARKLIAQFLWQIEKKKNSQKLLSQVNSCGNSATALAQNWPNGLIIIRGTYLKNAQYYVLRRCSRSSATSWSSQTKWMNWNCRIAVVWRNVNFVFLVKPRW